MADSYPKRADHFKQWSEMMLKQAIVPDRLEYKPASSMKKAANGGTRKRRKRTKRFRIRKRQQQE